MKPLLLTLFGFLSIAATLSASEYEVYLLAGQSNMEGFGYSKELPQGYGEFDDSVLIFHGNVSDDGERLDGKGIWAPLQPGHGTGFKSNGKANELSDRFGPELGFAEALREESPDTKIAIIKYAKGGTALDSLATQNSGRWHTDFYEKNGVNQYDHCIATIRRALKNRDIDGDGEVDTLVPAGIVWMQGESDGHELGPSERYAENLDRLMNLFRAALRDDSLPVVVGRISDSGQDEKDGLMWDFGNVIRAKQAEYCDKDPNASLVTTTDDYGYSDVWHYDSDGFIDLGEQFGKAMIGLRK